MAEENQEAVYHEKGDETSKSGESNSTGEEGEMTKTETLFSSSKGDELSVTFSQAKLKNVSDSTGQYCRLTVGSKEDVTRSSESRNPTNPTWAEEKKCTLMAGISFIFIEIFERNIFKSDMKIACAFISIDQIKEKGTKKGDWYPLFSAQGEDGQRGQIQLITSYTCKTTAAEGPFQQKLPAPDNMFLTYPTYFHGRVLTVDCAQARLKQEYGFLKMDLYCVLKLGSAMFQTKRSSSTNPRWGAKATFKVEHGVTSLFVEIYRSTLPRDTKIAWASILIEQLLSESSKEKTDWYTLSGNQGTNKEGEILLSCWIKTESVQQTVKTEASQIVHNVPRQLEQKVTTRINVLLLGDTKYQKSLIGNAILGKTSGFCEKTETTQIKIIERENLEINIINTGDLYSPQHRMRNDEVVLESAKLAMDFPDGIHVFLVTCNGKISEGLGKILSQLQKIYGLLLYDHCVLVVRDQKIGATEDPLRSFVTVKNEYLSNHILGKSVTSVSDSCLQEVLDTILEVNRLNCGQPLSNKYFDAARQQLFEKDKRRSNMKMVHEFIFKHISYTTRDKSIPSIKQILNEHKLGESDRLIELSRDKKFDVDVGAIRLCTSWCVKDLEAFINITLTKTMLRHFCKNSDTVQRCYDKMKLPLQRALQDAIQIQTSRMQIIDMFNTDVEKTVRDFMRQNKFLELQHIRKEVENGSVRENLTIAISKSIGKEYPKKWGDIERILSLRQLLEYFQIIQAISQV